MAVAYNPKVVTDQLVLYFDANNIKSLSGDGTWKSLVSQDQVTTTLTPTLGFLSQNNTNISQLNAVNMNSYSNVSVVVSLISNNSNKGTLFSLYGNNTMLYDNTGITSTPAEGGANSTGTTDLSYSYANSGIIVLPGATNGTTATQNNISYSYANSGIIVLSGATNGTTATQNNISYSYANSGIIALPAADNGTTATSQELAFDIPDLDASIYIDNQAINTRFRDGSYEQTVSSSFEASNNDVFVFVFKKSATDYSIKIYKNGKLSSQSSAVSNLANFGTNMSFMSRNNIGNITTALVRTFLIYSKELTTEEVSSISLAVRKI